MASHRMLKGGKAQILFRFAGRQYSRTIPVGSEREAMRAAAAVEEAIGDVGRGKLAVPEGCDVAAFLFSGGRVAQRVGATTEAPPGPPTVEEVGRSYRENLTPGSKEPNTRETEDVHWRHLARILGGATPLPSIDLAAAQRYADRRASEGVARVTIGKELTTVLVVWGWACRRGIVPAPTWGRKDVTMPKGEPAEPFLSWEEVEARVAAERPDAAGRKALWERLWLDVGQVSECLAWVEGRTRHPFLPAMFAFAAYTGARRSEIIRSERADWDFAAGVVSVREKKADTSRKFTRRPVPISPPLAKAMRDWFARCPETRWAISTADGEPIGPRMATKYFRGAVKGGRWSALHGWHVFRHSLASNMASAGTDQRVIDAILGHHTEEMSRRYRHLLPRAKRDALSALFPG